MSLSIVKKPKEKIEVRQVCKPVEKLNLKEVQKQTKKEKTIEK